MALHSYNSLTAGDDDDTPDAADAKNAADLIRQKVARIYEDEPDARQERTEADAETRRSKHQQRLAAPQHREAVDRRTPRLLITKPARV